MPGPGELLIILVIVLLIFGAGKLPAIGDALGRSIKNFRRTAAGNDEIEVGDAKPGEALAAKKARAELKNASADVEDAEVVPRAKKVANNDDI